MSKNSFVEEDSLRMSTYYQFVRGPEAAKFVPRCCGRSPWGRPGGSGSSVDPERNCFQRPVGWRCPEKKTGKTHEERMAGAWFWGQWFCWRIPAECCWTWSFKKKHWKSYKASHIFSWTPWNSAHSNKFPWHWFNHAREKIDWLTPLQLYFPTLQRIAQRASIFIAFFSHADWHIGSNRLLQSGRLILGKVIAQCEARQSHQDILRVWRWKTCESSFDGKWLWTFIVKGGMSHIVTFYHAESQITKSISRLQTEVWIIDSWNITSSWHPVSLTVASESCDLIILMSFKSMGLVEQTSRVSCGSCSINFGDPEILENPVVKVVRNLIIWGSWFWTHTISSTWHSHRFPVLTSDHQAEQQPLCFPDSWHPPNFSRFLRSPGCFGEGAQKPWSSHGYADL